MTKAQKEIVAKVMKRAESGPSFAPGEPDPERAARLWAQTWIVEPLAAVLANADGEITSSEMTYRTM